MTVKKQGDFAINRESLYGITNEPTYAGVTSFMRRKYTQDLDRRRPRRFGCAARYGDDESPRSALRATGDPGGIRQHLVDASLRYGRSIRSKSLRSSDYGDCFFDFGRPETIPEAIEAHAAEIIGQGPALLSLGGDHFIAWPLLKAHAGKYGQPLSLLHFDAHSDTWEDEEGRVDHGTMFWHAAKQGLIDPQHSVQIGLRTTNDDTLGFNIFDAPYVHENGIGKVIRKTRKILGERPVYLSFDIDCLDPSFAPGTGTPVCGGLSSHQAIQILRGLTGINLIGMDIVEVAPAYDIGEITALAGATLAVEMINMYANRPGAV